MPSPANTISDIIRGRARVAPDALAILAPGRTSLAFAALVDALDTTIEHLAQAGFGRADRIALALPDGPEMAVAVLAVSGGATCLPLNPALDEGSYRVALSTLRADALMVADADTPATRAAETMSVPVIRIVFSKADPAGVFTLRTSSSRPPRKVEPAASDDVALVLHTSGTTAKPKAVPLTQQRLAGPALERARQYGLTSADRCLCVRPLFTSGGMRRCLFPALAVGGSIVCTPGLVGNSFVAWLEEFEPTFYSGAPAVHRALLDELEARVSVPRFKLKFILSASAALPTQLGARLEERLGVPVLQGYGMTEAGVVAQNPLPPARGRAGSVGLPAGNEFAVLGDGGAMLPPGEAGEIVVRGPEVFAGYEGDAVANRLAFVDGWFRTGDLGYVDSDGYLFIVGRMKELINRGGFKVSPTAVDAVLLRHPDVADAAAFAVPHPTLGEDVVAAVVLREAAGVTPRTLRDFTFAHLASFMVPSQIILAEELPRSVSGKLQRAQLESLMKARLRPPFTSPRGPREERIAALFAEVLGKGPVGAFDNFFELGGDSLRGAQLVSRANAAFGSDVEVAALFKRPTVAEFAAELRDTSAEAEAAPPPLVAMPRGIYRPDVADAKTSA